MKTFKIARSPSISREKNEYEPLEISKQKQEIDDQLILLVIDERQNIDAGSEH